jgi:hypothetical protein
MSRKKKNAFPDLLIVLDLGGSLTKVVYMGSDKQPKSLCMEPEVLELPKVSLQSYESQKMGMDAALPADRAWVGSDEKFYAVGYLAREQFNGNAGLSQLKVERAAPKALAAVWAASVDLQLGNEFSAAVGVLLPPGEFENALRVREAIEQGLKAFETPNGTLNVTLAHWDCKPEGAGVYLMHTCNRDSALIKDKSIAVVMVGFRNASILLSQRGAVTKRITSELGFIKLLKKVIEKTSGLDVNHLAESISRAGDPPSFDALFPVLRSTDELQRKDEVLELRKAIMTSRQEYTSSLTSWFKEVLPQRLDEVVLCGGTSDYLKQELSNHFKRTTIVWHGVELPSGLSQERLGNRMCDAFGLYEFLRNAIWAEVSQSVRTRSKSKSTSKKVEVARGA